MELQKLARVATYTIHYVLDAWMPTTVLLVKVLNKLTHNIDVNVVNLTHTKLGMISVTIAQIIALHALIIIHVHHVILHLTGN